MGCTFGPPNSPPPGAGFALGSALAAPVGGAVCGTDGLALLSALAASDEEEAALDCIRWRASVGKSFGIGLVGGPISGAFGSPAFPQGLALALCIHFFGTLGVVAVMAGSSVQLNGFPFGAGKGSPLCAQLEDSPLGGGW